MYRLVLYSLTVMVVVSIAFGFSNVLPLNGVHMLLSLLVLVAASMLSNFALGYIFKVPVNVESMYITAFILFLIIPPTGDMMGHVILALTAILAMASKFVLNIKGKHIFNPAAIAVLLVGLSGLVLPTWWVGSGVMLPLILITGLLMVRKVRRFDLFLTFVVVAVIAIVATNINYGGTFLSSLKGAFVSWPLMFFATIMLTEPLTTPAAKKWRIAYGVIVGLLFGIPFNVGPFFSTPELALVLGNIFSYIVSPKQRLVLRLKEIVKIGPALYDFIFTPNRPMAFVAGQYMEWTLGHSPSDGRGNRRFFTIASAPSEKEIHLGVKVPQDPSSFKTALLGLKPGDELMAGTLSGEFNLSKDTTKKIVAIAGGIGITPFRSIIKHMVDTQEQRDLVLFYVAADKSEFVYTDIFDSAKPLGVKPLYMTDRITEELINKEVSDFKNRLYYISGPNGMVEAYKTLLTSMGVPRKSIKTDYFPGY